MATKKTDKKIVKSFKTTYPTECIEKCVLYVSGRKVKEIESGAS